MIRLVNSDPKDRSACLAGLNLCFPGWGEAARFDRLYNRTSDPRPADLLVAEVDGQTVAGLSVIYRWIGRDDEPHELVGVLGGAWTHPDVRGHGLFGQLLDHATDLACSQGATVALAFVTGERASLGQLDRRSARVLEAGLFTKNFPSDSQHFERANALSPDEAALAFTRRSDRTGRVSIKYDAQSWRAQMVDREEQSRVVQLGDQAIAALGQEGDGSMILDALAFESASVPVAETVSRFVPGRVTIYESGPESFKRYASTGWVSTKARTFLIPLASSRFLDGDWKISGGDRL
jgi:GNAT superfamily N-acetyltransferase